MSTLYKKRRKKTEFLYTSASSFSELCQTRDIWTHLSFHVFRKGTRAGSNSWGFSWLARNFDVSFKKICSIWGGQKAVCVCGAMTWSPGDAAAFPKAPKGLRRWTQGSPEELRMLPKDSSTRGWLLSSAGNWNCPGKAGRMGDLRASAPRKKSVLGSVPNPFTAIPRAGGWETFPAAFRELHKSLCVPLMGTVGCQCRNLSGRCCEGLKIGSWPV